MHMYLCIIYIQSDFIFIIVSNITFVYFVYIMQYFLMLKWLIWKITLSYTIKNVCFWVCVYVCQYICFVGFISRPTSKYTSKTDVSFTLHYTEYCLQMIGFILLYWVEQYMKYYTRIKLIIPKYGLKLKFLC